MKTFEMEMNDLEMEYVELRNAIERLTNSNTVEQLEQTSYYLHGVINTLASLHLIHTGECGKLRMHVAYKYADTLIKLVEGESEMEKVAKELNEEMNDMGFEGWIDLDNYMTEKGFASNEGLDWECVLNDGNVVYKFDNVTSGEEGVQIFFNEECGDLRVEKVIMFY